MTLRHTILRVATLGGALALGAPATATPGPVDYEIAWWTIDSGGGTSAGGIYQLSGTLGQFDAATASGDNGLTEWCLAGGYWSAGCEPAPPPLCPADTDGDGMVNVADLVNVILDWGPCPAGCPGDVSGDGQADVEDLVQVLLAWGPC
jgi:hypothetical protein